MAFITTAYTTADGLSHWPDCHAGDNLYYSIDFDAWLTAEGDTLVSVAWSLPSSITSDDDFLEGNKAYIKLYAATPGTYKIECTLSSVDAGKTQTNVVPMYLKVV